ncbi:hypothetical protein NONO_c30010 [Nocardia nova SH22a]|uniref:Uncharacterized protein n=1 Tax=Nocardia nova SH22a TaxID=1415166 RepID=W5TFK8_9NOCA|nr:hypothetical protein NONO_c30010 [Nocardia nova SH22a]
MRLNIQYQNAMMPHIAIQVTSSRSISCNITKL